jgi:hypothetical protein
MSGRVMGIPTSRDRVSVVGVNRLRVDRSALIGISLVLLVIAIITGICARHASLLWSRGDLGGTDVAGSAVRRSGSSLQDSRKVAVEPALLDTGRIALTDMQSLPIADIGAAGADVKTDKSKDSDFAQSDFEVVSARAEPLHPVASVPMDQSTQAIINVPLAVVGPAVVASRGAREGGPRCPAQLLVLVRLRRSVENRLLLLR